MKQMKSKRSVEEEVVVMLTNAFQWLRLFETEDSSPYQQIHTFGCHILAKFTIPIRPLASEVIHTVSATAIGCRLTQFARPMKLIRLRHQECKSGGKGKKSHLWDEIHGNDPEDKDYDPYLPEEVLPKQVSGLIKYVHGESPYWGMPIERGGSSEGEAVAAPAAPAAEGEVVAAPTAHGAIVVVSTIQKVHAPALAPSPIVRKKRTVAPRKPVAMKKLKMAESAAIVEEEEEQEIEPATSSDSDVEELEVVDPVIFVHNYGKHWVVCMIIPKPKVINVFYSYRYNHDKDVLMQKLTIGLRRARPFLPIYNIFPIRPSLTRLSSAEILQPRSPPTSARKGFEIGKRIDERSKADKAQGISCEQYCNAKIEFLYIDDLESSGNYMEYADFGPHTTQYAHITFVLRSFMTSFTSRGKKTQPPDESKKKKKMPDEKFEFAVIYERFGITFPILDDEIFQNGRSICLPLFEPRLQDCYLGMMSNQREHLKSCFLQQHGVQIPQETCENHGKHIQSLSESGYTCTSRQISSCRWDPAQ
ncbi:hypothetical protein DH2020_039376 [Rehmannia glutinosa]|uniref:Ubiquitin-like protease family profile domain-containing protein n=1 Tax=Rehmannia glutinosa TaxID=99300 RepID=A0ABR0UYP9_REHGL